MDTKFKVILTLFFVTALMTYCYYTILTSTNLHIRKSHAPKSELFGIPYKFTKELIHVRNKMLNEGVNNQATHWKQQRPFKETPHPVQNSVQYWHVIDSIQSIKTISHSCTPYLHISQSMNIPYCGPWPVFKYYMYGTSVKQCYVKHEKMNIRNCFSRNNVALTKQQTTDFNPWYLQVKPFIHVIKNGRTDIYGNVLVENLIIKPDSCHKVTLYDDLVGTNFIKVKEVFLISQFFSPGYFHATVESIPRMALYLDFLKAFDTIYIHITDIRAHITDAMVILGINPKRLIKGTVHADIVYFPQGGGCGTLVQPSGHLMVTYFHNFIGNNMNSHENERNNVILIKRSPRRRWIDPVQHKQLATYLSDLSKRNHFKFHIFDDKKLPAFNETIKMFYNAILVIGAHGSGLANTLYSRPETYIIEIMCKSGPNFCYGDLSQLRGMHHYIVSSSWFSCHGMRVNLKTVLKTIDYFVKEILKQKHLFHIL